MKTADIRAALNRDPATPFALRLSNDAYCTTVRRVFLLERGWVWMFPLSPGGEWKPLRDPKSRDWAAMVENENHRGWTPSVVAARDIDPLAEVEAVASARKANSTERTDNARRCEAAAKALQPFAPSAKWVASAVSISAEDAAMIAAELAAARGRGGA